MRTGLLQITGTDDPAENLEMLSRGIDGAVAERAGFVLTPEVSNCISGSMTRQRDVVRSEGEDTVLVAMRERAARHGIWLLLGSLAIRTDDPDGRLANRSFLIGPEGGIVARYDKIHMFDVDVSEAETYRESAGYRPGGAAVLARTAIGAIGMSVCYDVRFPHLYRRLAAEGAEILTVPAAFSPVTGAAHWEPLLRARAIETGCYVLAPAQCGTHPKVRGRQRATHGHSLAVSPWGEVLADGGAAPGLSLVDLDLAEVAAARAKVPSLSHGRDYDFTLAAT